MDRRVVRLQGRARLLEGADQRLDLFLRGSEVPHVVLERVVASEEDRPRPAAGLEAVSRRTEVLRSLAEFVEGSADPVAPAEKVCRTAPRSQGEAGPELGDGDHLLPADFVDLLQPPAQGWRPGARRLDAGDEGVDQLIDPEVGDLGCRGRLRSQAGLGPAGPRFPRRRLDASAGSALGPSAAAPFGPLRLVGLPSPSGINATRAMPASTPASS